MPIVLLLASLLSLSARAAVPYAEDAAAVAASLSAVVPLSSASVSVHDALGPAPAGAASASVLRRELFRLGIAVRRPEAAADYDLRGLIDEGVWTAELWRRSDGSLAGTAVRTLGGTAPHPEISPRRARL